MFLAPGFLCATLFACQAPGSPVDTPPPPLTDGPSVEKLIAEAKLRAERLRSTSNNRLTKLVVELDQPYDKDPERVEAAISEILTYKDSSTRPLVEALREPKNSPRAQNAARALSKSPAVNIVPELESALAAGSSPEQRARIAWILGRREGDRTSTILKRLLTDPDSEVVGQAALSLGALKVKDSATDIAAKLLTAGPALGSSLLVALSSLDEPKVVPQIVAFIESPAAVECAGAIAEVVKGLKAKELLAPALRIVLRGASAIQDSTELVRAVEKVIHSGDRDAISTMKAIMKEPGMSYEVKEECAYALHAAKDQLGKDWLLRPVNDALRENPDGATLLRSRARIYLRLRLFKEAQRDYDEIKKLSAGGKKITIDGDFWIEIARAGSGAKTYQSAADAIRNAMALGMRPKNFRDYSEFAEMKKISKFAGLFEGD